MSSWETARRGGQTFWIQRKKKKKRIRGGGGSEGVMKTIFISIYSANGRKPLLKGNREIPKRGV